MTNGKILGLDIGIASVGVGIILLLCKTKNKRFQALAFTFTVQIIAFYSPNQRAISRSTDSGESEP